ncbi:MULTISPECIES: hypothetical protein [unclassified Microcoleus]|uniref:hypothetical protein n=1 Tax=unclassified Microcoleus TaxID=2642155 RepID=UPI002FD4A0FE
MQSIKFKPVIGIGTDVVYLQGIYIEVADNDMGISKYLPEPLSAPWLAELTISSKIPLRYRIIVEQHQGYLRHS